MCTIAFAIGHYKDQQQKGPHKIEEEPQTAKSFFSILQDITKRAPCVYQGFSLSEFDFNIGDDDIYNILFAMHAFTEKNIDCK